MQKLCRNGLHEVTPETTVASSDHPRCAACLQAKRKRYLDRRSEARAAARSARPPRRSKMLETLDSLRALHGDQNCWPWPKYRGPAGYGRVNHAGKPGQLAYRVAYQLLVDPVPDGLHLDHLCRVRECVNPAHLEPVTCQENLLRSPLTFQGRNARKTHCPQGHRYDEANTYVDGSGGRRCRACRRARQQQRRSQVVT